MECPICYNLYDSTRFVPMVGTCGHSVCNQCVSQLEEGKCPLCTKITMRHASRNYLAIELLAEIDNKSKEQVDQLIGFNHQLSFMRKDIQFNVPPPKPQGFQNPTVEVQGSSNQPIAQHLQPQGANAGNGTSIDPFSVYINHIGGWSEEDVFKHFKPFGTIDRYGFGGVVNKGFALVTYKHDISARNAIQAMNGAPIGQFGQPIVVELKTVKSHNAEAVSDFAQRRHTMMISPKIVVKNLPDVTEDQVRNAFASDGEIVNVALRNINGVFSGIAFVYFANMFGVTQALKRNGTFFPQTTIKMKVEAFKAN